MNNPFTTKDQLVDIINQVVLGEKKLTDAELKKREEIAQAMERDNPGMDMGKKMAIATAQAKKVAEEAEQIDEISDKTLGNYVSKAVVDVHNDAKFAGESGSKDASNKAFKRLLGVKSAAARLSKQNVSGGRISNYRAEEVNLDEQLENFWEAYTTMFNEAEDQQQNILLRAMAKDPTDLMKMKRAIKMGDKALTNPALRQEILKMLDQMMHLTTADPSLLQRTRMGFQKAKTIGEAIGAKDKQDEGEYGYEGDMAMSQLRTIIRNSEEMMKVLKKDTDLPEWVQSKITLATDYLQTANDYLMSELEEETEINELSKGLMYRYFSKADKGGSEKRYAGMKLAAQKTIPLKSSVKIQGTGELDPAKEDKRMRKEEVELGEADEKEVGKEIKAARLKKDSSDFMSKSSLFSGGARDVAKHLGKKDDEKYGEAMRKVKDTPVSKFVASRKGDGKVRIEEVEKSPIDGARPVKSKESAAVRVKKIADGMRKLYTPKKDNK